MSYQIWGGGMEPSLAFREFVLDLDILLYFETREGGSKLSGAENRSQTLHFILPLS